MRPIYVLENKLLMTQGTDTNCWYFGVCWQQIVFYFFTLG